MSENFSEPGVHYWTCPDGVTTVEVEARSGASWDGTPGQTVRRTMEVTPGHTYEIAVGAGGRLAMPGTERAGEDGHVTLSYSPTVGSSGT